MMVLVCYDVSTLEPAGQRRLRRVAKVCKDYGQRAQLSVFECEVNPAQWVNLRQKLLDEVNLEEDSLKFYFLGANWRKRVEQLGIKKSYDPDDPLIV
jgi:CRISPR-associated protein Cas2